MANQFKLKAYGWVKIIINTNEGVEYRKGRVTSSSLWQRENVIRSLIGNIKSREEFDGLEEKAEWERNPDVRHPPRNKEKVRVR